MTVLNDRTRLTGLELAMCDECGKVCWQMPPMTEEEQEELERHIARLMQEQSDEM